jgi:hypothetical protein
MVCRRISRAVVRVLSDYASEHWSEATLTRANRVFDFPFFNFRNE